MMSETRASEVAAAVALIRPVLEMVKTLPETPQERVSTDGIVVMLNDVIRRIETLGDDEGE